MFCPKCGKQLRDGAKFCTSCGAQLPSAVNKATPAGSTNKATSGVLGKVAGLSTVSKVLIGGVALVAVISVGSAVAITGSIKNTGSTSEDSIAGKTKKSGSKNEDSGKTKDTNNNDNTNSNNKNVEGGGENGRNDENSRDYLEKETDSAKEELGIAASSEGVSISIDEGVYYPGETIAVEYEGISEQVIADGAWIGMAGYLNDASEYQVQELLIGGSGMLPLKAPEEYGQYQIRYFKAQEATEDNLVLRLEFTVADPNEDIPDLDFDTAMYRISEYYHDEAFVSAHGDEVSIEFDDAYADYGSADDYMSNLNEVGPFSEDLIFTGHSIDKHSAVTFTGVVSKKCSGVDQNGDNYYRYDGQITDFDPFTSYYFEEITGYWRSYDNKNEYAPSDRSTFIIYIYENGHKQIWLYACGTQDSVFDCHKVSEYDRSHGYPIWGKLPSSYYEKTTLHYEDRYVFYAKLSDSDDWVYVRQQNTKENEKDARSNLSFSDNFTVLERFVYDFSEVGSYPTATIAVEKDNIEITFDTWTANDGEYEMYIEGMELKGQLDNFREEKESGRTVYEFKIESDFGWGENIDALTETMSITYTRRKSEKNNNRAYLYVYEDGTKQCSVHLDVDVDEIDTAFGERTKESVNCNITMTQNEQPWRD